MRTLSDEAYKELIGYIPIPEHDVRKVARKAEQEAWRQVEEQFIWGQVPYHDIKSGTIKERTMHCISDEDWQELKTEEKG
ncbi:hypothetical protein LCGC14_0350110 [marine sediment metagenome]|uniref:Uncharacterized protein n=1 Tax=marine sediment metagenome TaxID=412755 RepID=A0A0F9TGU4_9ZZZZ